jgi:hypothetical protein
MVSGASIEVRNRLIRVAPNVIVFFIGIVGIIVVNTIQQIIEQTKASHHIIAQKTVAFCVIIIVIVRILLLTSRLAIYQPPSLVYHSL